MLLTVLVMIKWSIGQNIQIISGGIKGGHGGTNAPSRRLCPPHLLPQSEEKNCQNQPFSANFWIFAPSESHFAPSMPPTKKFLVAPLQIMNNHAQLYATFNGQRILTPLLSGRDMKRSWSYFVMGRKVITLITAATARYIHQKRYTLLRIPVSLIS